MQINIRENKKLNNIQKSLKHQERMEEYAGSSLENFERCCHIKGDALHIYALYKSGQTSLPKNVAPYRSYSKNANLVPNMRHKTQLINIAKADHVINGDFKTSDLEKFRECGRGLTSAIGRDIRTKLSHTHLINTFFCHFKWCPVNQHLTAKKRFNQIYSILKFEYQKYGYEPIFITLTIPSTKPTPHRVRKAAKELTKSWKKMSKYKLYNGDNRLKKQNKGILKGWIEKLEYTYNYGRNRFHLHLHIIGLVRKSYINKYGSKYYVPKAQWKKDWKRALPKKLGNQTKIISVEAPYCKDKTGKKIEIQDCHTKDKKKKCIKEASSEIAKYESKSSDFEKLPKLNGKFNNKWYKELAKYYHVTPKQARGIEIYGNLKNKYKTYLEKHLTKNQLQTVNAFHAMYKGLRRIRIIHFGGCTQYANWLYHKATGKNSKKNIKKNKNVKLIRKLMNIPKVIYYSKVHSNFLFRYKDYLDKPEYLDKEDISTLKNQGLGVAPKATAIANGKLDPSPKRLTNKKAKNIIRKRCIAEIYNILESDPFSLPLEVTAKYTNAKDIFLHLPKKLAKKFINKATNTLKNNIHYEIAK